MLSQIPLLSFHEKHKSRLSTDLEHRTAVNPSNHLPSCCFFTILNSRQTLTALTTSPDAKQVAAGFSDSMIRVYNLAGLAKQRGFLSKRVREQGLAPPVASKRRRGVDEMDVDLEDEELQVWWRSTLSIFVGTYQFECCFGFAMPFALAQHCVTTASMQPRPTKIQKQTHCRILMYKCI